MKGAVPGRHVEDPALAGRLPKSLHYQWADWRTMYPVLKSPMKTDISRGESRHRIATRRHSAEL